MHGTECRDGVGRLGGAVQGGGGRHSTFIEMDPWVVSNVTLFKDN